VCTNIGGLKNFLPLFKQVDFDIEPGSANASDFLRTLVHLVWDFCEQQPDIEADFINSAGMKCLAYLLSRVKSTSLHQAAINHFFQRMEDFTRSIIGYPCWMTLG
jgi:hypothetical protein